MVEDAATTRLGIEGPLSDGVRNQLALPLRMGGLGLTRAAQIASAAWYAGQAQAAPHLLRAGLAATQARFRRALTYPDTIAIGARLLSMGDDRFDLQHRIVSKQLGQVATEGQGTIVSFDYPQGKKVPLPAELKERIRLLEQSS